MINRRMIAAAVSCSVAVAGLVTANTASSATPAAKVQPRVVAGSSALAVVKTITGIPSPSGLVVDVGDDTVYVSIDAAAADPDGLVVIDGRTGTVTRTVGLGTGGPRGVAVNQEDDTVYVALYSGNQLAVVNGRNADDSVRVSMGDPYQVAVNQVDDTVYVTRKTNDLGVVNGRTNVATAVPLGSGADPEGLAINQRDDTVYVALDGPDTLRSLKGSNLDDSQSTAGLGNPFGVAVDQRDDTVYVANFFGPTLAVLRGRADAVVRTVRYISGTGTPDILAVDSADDTVYAAATSNSGSINVLDGRNLDDSYVLTPSNAGSWTRGIGVDDTGGIASGLVYLAQNNGVRVLAQVTPTLVTTTGSAGDPVSITATAPRLPYAVDDSTVASVAFGGVLGTSLTAGSPGAWTVTAPSGTGAVPVTVTLNGGRQVHVGTFTYPSAPNPPAPTPVYPPDAPTGVKATAGSGEATVTWTAPVYAGSYPITDYEVTSSPGSQSCLSMTTSCTVTGLTGGETYTFTVRALNGAGWGPYSAPSNAATPPVKSILITGSRDASDDRYVKVQGTTTDLAGRQVTPYVRFPGQTGATAGTGVRTVRADGTFTWKRKTGKRVYVYFQHAEVRSNTVTITPR